MKRIVVVGASLAGFKTVDALRANGFEGAITLIGAEDLLPYDRPPLSKEFLVEDSVPDIDFVPPSWYHEKNIDLLLGQEATGLDLANKNVLVGNTRVPYDELVIATGARPRNPFAELPRNVFTLRTMDDALSMREALRAGKSTVIVGGGFIGLEVASAAHNLGQQVTVIELADIPLSRNLGAETAVKIGDYIREQGVELACGRSVVDFHGDEVLTGVTLDNGTHIECDVAVIGIGAIPNTEWLEDSGLTISHAGVHCDSNGNAAPSIWAVGDVSAWADHQGVVHRHEHWTNANLQAQAVAANIVGESAQGVKAISYVWSDQFGRRLSIVGTTHLFDQVCILNEAQSDFASLYAQDGRIVGACIVNQPKLYIQARRWISEEKPIAEIAEWNEAIGLQQDSSVRI